MEYKEYVQKNFNKDIDKDTLTLSLQSIMIL